MNNRSFQRLLLRTLAIPLALLVLLATMLVLEISLLTSSLHEVDHTDEVVAANRQALVQMVDMETGVRGYFVTGDATFLQPYEEAQLRVPDALDKLQRLVADNPGQLERIYQLRALDRQWMDFAKQFLAAAPKHPTRKQFAESKSLMDAIRRMHRELNDTEIHLRESRVRQATNIRRMVIGGAMVLSLFTAFLFLTLTRKELRKLSNSYESHLQAEIERTRQLQESQELFRTTLKSLGEGVVSTDSADHVVFMNPMAERLTGWTLQEAIGRPLREIVRFVDEARRIELDGLSSVASRPELVGELLNHTILISRSGTESAVEQTSSPIRDESGHLSGKVIVFRDITTRRKTEQALRTSERLTLAGRLTAAIAHEIRNPLDTVKNIVYLMRSSRDLTEEQRDNLGILADEVDRIAQITAQLLVFHREATKPVAVNMQNVVDGLLTLFGAHLRRANIEVIREYQAQHPVRGFPGELRQVVSNFISNALDAMPQGGKLIVRISETTFPSDPSRAAVRISIADTGSGIPPEVRKDLFAPFYTTKGEKGTGLGLWVSRGIIEKHEGTVRMHSSIRPGHSGTVFSIWLPSIRQTVETTAPAVEPVA